LNCVDREEVLGLSGRPHVVDCDTVAVLYIQSV